MPGLDNERLHQLIVNHLHYTDSNRAREILADWENYRTKFVRVMPVDYRRALMEMDAKGAATTAKGARN